MKNPHDHEDIIKSLKSQAAEIKPAPKPEPEEEFDLDKELAAIEADVPTPEPETRQLNPDDMIRDQILRTLHERSDAPTVEQIEAWKTKYGQHGVQVIALDPENVYIYTFLTESQWEKVASLSQKVKGNNSGMERAMRDAVLKSAILWPKVSGETFRESRAGLSNTLYELILVASYFLTPQQALTLTTTL